MEIGRHIAIKGSYQLVIMLGANQSYRFFNRGPAEVEISVGGGAGLYTVKQGQSCDHEGTKYEVRVLDSDPDDSAVLEFERL